MDRRDKLLLFGFLAYAISSSGVLMWLLGWTG